MKRYRSNLKILHYRKDHPFIFYFLLAYLGGIFIYILIFHIWFADYSKPMPLNEVGDFLAGVFSPLAFLFLYIGYKQNSESIKLQNEELKASTKALELQVEQMKESVDQQKIITEFQRLEIEERHNAVKPFFKTEASIVLSESSDQENLIYEFKINFINVTENIAKNIKYDYEAGVRGNIDLIDKMRTESIRSRLTSTEANYYLNRISFRKPFVLDFENIYGRRFYEKYELICFFNGSSTIVQIFPFSQFFGNHMQPTEL
ncbi:hypothetical protein PGJ95_01900 [Acinetobacter baumannii]|nr:hypothetical protein [Acinetobacter baumannii]MDA4907662.1 hypothetical protein [Acinetobacter baumannii]MDA4911441.1 hypothetical protein [Acinetobacter baumannii]MDA4936909.1 hypothetical protein [Acinetobacter baumannii]MDA4947740.1 hypothetical protein [Acinetobacter baumannii]